MHSESNTDRNRITAPPSQSGRAHSGTGHEPARPAPRTRQPWARMLKAVLDLAGEQAELVRHVEREWASATFSGSRHAVTLSFTGSTAAEAGEAFIVALPDHDFIIPRFLVADAQIIAVVDTQLPERKIVVEAQLLLLDRA